MKQAIKALIHIVKKNTFQIVGLVFLIFHTNVYADIDSNDVINLNLESIYQKDIGKRIALISGYFLNIPYQLEPLGEGPLGGINQEPLYRFDKFDCQTYVETVLALANSRHFSEFPKNILRIRYADGKASFYTRNHIIAIDWIPHNIQNHTIHFLRLPRGSYQFAKVFINQTKKKFYQQCDISRIKIENLTDQQKQAKLLQLHHYADRFNLINGQTLILPYISLQNIDQMTRYIPQGAIIMIVKPRPNGLLISHMGFGVWEDHILYFREASTLFGRVVDVPLLPYLSHQAKFSQIKGIMVLVAE